jgi:hypothetical protein
MKSIYEECELKVFIITWQTRIDFNVLKVKYIIVQKKTQNLIRRMGRSSSIVSLSIRHLFLRLSSVVLKP